MTILLLDIPEDADQLVDWLERQLIGLHLGELAAELEIVHRDTSRIPSSLDEIFAVQLPDVLAHGLRQAHPIQLRRLLQNPAALLELQERILMEGGERWFSLQVADDQWQAVNAGLDKLEAEFPPKPRPSGGGPVVSPRGYLSALVALALLAGLGLWVFQQSQPAGWGWNNAALVRTDLPADEYLRQLGQAAEAWKNQRPDNRDDLAKRIGEFRAGCQRLIDSEHLPLEPEDKAWLVDKCRAWDAKLAAAQTDLNEGADVLEIRNRVDGIQEKLTIALNAKADEIS